MDNCRSTTGRRVFLRQLRHDLRQGILARWMYALPILGFTLVMLLSFRNQVSFLNGQLNAPLAPTFADAAVYLFEGIDVYHPTPDSRFEIPVFWLVNNIYLLFMTAYYPIRDLSGFGKLFLLKSRRRSTAWASKCMWLLLSTVLIYLLEYLLIFLVFPGHTPLAVTPELQQILGRYDPALWQSGLWGYFVFLTPVLTTLTLGMIQMVLSLLWLPIAGFVVDVVILTASAYYFSPLLIGNYTMLRRSSIMLGNGIQYPIAIAVEIMILMALAIFGGWYFKRYDILEHRKG